MVKMGFLDSGIGGLTVLEEFCVHNKINSSQPSGVSKYLEQIIYFADFANLPYGKQTQKELRKILLGNLAWLADKVDILVIACNSCSVLIDPEIEAAFPHIQIINLLEVTISWLAQSLRNVNNLGILSTFATKQNGAYERTIRTIFPQMQLQTVACPNLVDLIEADPLHPRIENTLTNYLKEFSFLPSQLLLGCTHYPLVSQILNKLCPQTKLLNPAVALRKNILVNYFFNEETKFSWLYSGSLDLTKDKIKTLKAYITCLQYFFPPV